MILKIYLFTLLVLFLTNTIYSQNPGLYIPRNVEKAFNNGTRSSDGKPGINYWQNRADYNINVEFDPKTRLVRGNERIIYSNNSPDTLNEIFVHLFPNLFKKGNPRDFAINPEDEGDGLILKNIVYNGKGIDTSVYSNYNEYRGTLLRIKLSTPIFPKTKADFSFDWNYVLNKESNVRTGTIDSSTFFIAYFYPHIAVYDDIDGWNDFQYTGGVEFYNDFADYEVSITVPKDYIINATGVLQNPDEVLTDKYVKRYQSALISNTVVKIIDSNDIINKNITKANAKNTWKFKAANVTDFTFALSDHYLWDGSGLIVDKKSGRRVFINAAYDKESKDFYKVAKTARAEIEYMSTVLPGVPFPYPTETIYNGSGGMEYPMMVNDSSVPDSSMVGLTAHEISHTYFPFYMGTNESKYAWMDEGWAAYIDFMTTSTLYSIEVIKNSRVKAYKNAIGNDLDLPIIAIAKYLKSPVYRYNAYIKAAYFYNMLKEYLGDDLFFKALHVYMDRWHGKHPMPYDFFNSMSNAVGEDLTWLIKPWFFEYGYLDLGIKEITKAGNKYNIIIEKKGIYPGGFKLKIAYSDGTTEIISKSVSVWKDGNKKYIVEIPAVKKIIKAALFDKIWLDADSSNDKFIIN
ncbi:MAG: M1 family metallopeptidase [Ignavibacteriaceae bacterium]|nr:M1 family metallopeptidase [Ignavibacteriaceae bacterium]